MVWLVRHGESEANAGLVTADFRTIALTDLGKRQAAALALMIDLVPAQIGTSPYLRARQTAAPLLSKYPHLRVLELPVQEFTYLASERCDGLDTASRLPLVEEYWLRMDHNHKDSADAESFAELCDRAAQFLEVAREWSGPGLVFTHEQFIRAVLIEVFYGSIPSATAMRRFYSLRDGLPIPNASICRLEYRDGRWWFGGIDNSYLENCR